MLKVNPITIRRYIDNGKLPAVRVGTGVRVRREAVDKFITDVVPKKGKKPRAVRNEKPLAPDDALWRVVGIGQSEEPTDIAKHKDDYLADAYAAKRV